MKETGILFTPDNMHAILDGRKTQTRRIVTLNHAGRVSRAGRNWHLDDPDAVKACPYGTVGDRLYVKEGLYCTTKAGHTAWRRDGKAIFPYRDWQWERNTLSPLHMPKWAARLWLELTDVRLERLQEISEADALAEGVTVKPDAEIAARVAADTPARMEYWALWQSINGPGSWDANPWVWCLTFKQVQP